MSKYIIPYLSDYTFKKSFSIITTMIFGLILFTILIKTIFSPNVAILTLTTIIFVFVYNFTWWDIELRQRKKMYKLARHHAGLKPLLTIGTPMGMYPRSEYVVDIAPRHKDDIKGDITNLDMFKDKEFSTVFAPHVLEHIDDIEKAYSELKRVADKVYICYPSRFSLISYQPQHLWKIYDAPPNGELKYKRIRGR